MAKRAFLDLIRSFLGLALLTLAVPAVAQAPPRIVAVGDLHGDYAAWLDIVRAAGLINAAGHFKPLWPKPLSLAGESEVDR